VGYRKNFFYIFNLKKKTDQNIKKAIKRKSWTSLYFICNWVYFKNEWEHWFGTNDKNMYQIWYTIF